MILFHRLLTQANERNDHPLKNIYDIVCSEVRMFCSYCTFQARVVVARTRLSGVIVSRLVTMPLTKNNRYRLVLHYSNWKEQQL